MLSPSGCPCSEDAEAEAEEEADTLRSEEDERPPVVLIGREASSGSAVSMRAMAHALMPARMMELKSKGQGEDEESSDDPTEAVNDGATVLMLVLPRLPLSLLLLIVQLLLPAV